MPDDDADHETDHATGPATGPATGAAAGSTDQPTGVWGRMSGLQRLGLVVSVLIMTGALTLQAVVLFMPADATPATGASAPGASAPGASAPGGATGLAQGFGATPPPEGGGAQEPTDADHPLDEWSPAIFRAGFSFFVGFAIAFALRTFVKLSLIAIGFFFLALFGLQYAGFIDVNWGAIGDRYDSARDWIGSQFEGFVAFATGYLPSAAAFTGGLVVGFRRKG